MVISQSDGNLQPQQWDQHDHVLEEDQNVEAENQLLRPSPAFGNWHVTLVEAINLMDNSTALTTRQI